MVPKQSNNPVSKGTHHFAWRPTDRQAVREPIAELVEACYREWVTSTATRGRRCPSAPDHIHLSLFARSKHAQIELVPTVTSNHQLGDLGTSRTGLGGSPEVPWIPGCFADDGMADDVSTDDIAEYLARTRSW